ncbi:MAG: PLD nuclease N-terminal domain-containing protein [Actinobacteria bacterium]|nr:PLD nuclease N-terminal domain-containing protein [Actinomycetota bacterium]
MIRILPIAVEAVILVFCLIDVILAEDHRVRNLPKWTWILLIIVLPIVGGIAWLVAGRPLGSPTRQAPWPSRTAGYPEDERPAHLRHRAPDDNPEFLAKLAKDNTDHEAMLRKWEDDLRRREQQMRSSDEPEGPDPEQDAR